MDFKTSDDVWRQVGQTRLTDLHLGLVHAAVGYANLRVQWKLATPEERREMDAARTRAHNVLIDACNILGRNMAKAGESTEWRSLLGDDRQEIGDFACWVALFLGLSAR